MSSSETYPAGSMTVRGHKINIFTTDDGTWLAYPGNDRVKADTRDGLKLALGRHLKAATLTVEVPFVGGYGWSNEPIRKGVATALHSRHGAVLVRWEDGTKEQIAHGLKTLTGDTDPAEWKALVEAAQVADRALRDYEEANKINLAEEVRNAMSAAVDAAES